MKSLNTQKTALAVGTFVSTFHILWTILIIVGLAQPLLDFIFWLHMIMNPYHVTGFNIMQAAMLIAVTFAVGYVGGWVFAMIWNKVHK